MTPTFVSRTSLILALGAVLAWPVWGWAGERYDPIVLSYCANKKYDTPGSKPVWDCIKGEDISIGTWIYTCGQRMSEAMREMDAYIERMYAINGPGKKLIIYPGGLRSEKWNQVMKDCVEGRH